MNVLKTTGMILLAIAVFPLLPVIGIMHILAFASETNETPSSLDRPHHLPSSTIQPRLQTL